MTDIVERLRGDIPHRLIESHWTVDFEALDAEREEAVTEIERLREQVLALQHIADRDEQEIERLRKAIQDAIKEADEPSSDDPFDVIYQHGVAIYIIKKALEGK